MGSGECLEDLGLGSQVPRPETLGPHMPSLRSQAVCLLAARHGSMECPSGEATPRGYTKLAVSIHLVWR